MTNKYQEAIEILDYSISFYDFDSCYPEQAKLILETLQAGVEGRILPKLPDGWGVNYLAYTEEKAYVTAQCLKCGYIKGVNGAGKTPAEAMQNAIDKITPTEDVE